MNIKSINDEHEWYKCSETQFEYICLKCKVIVLHTSNGSLYSVSNKIFQQEFISCNEVIIQSILK